MDANIAIAQARGLRRVAADLDRVRDDYLKGDRTPADDNDATFPAEEFLGSMLAAPVVRALAAELALKAIAIKTTGDRERGPRPPQAVRRPGPENATGHRAEAQGRD